MPNLIGAVGALAALELHDRIGREFIARRVAELTSHAITGLDEIGVDLWTPRPARERAGIVFFRDSRHDELYAKLQEARIYSGHFLGGIRIEPHFYNTLAEIDSFLKVVRAHV
jgi:selenocysteine lyase/cysteine desulfurase